MRKMITDILDDAAADNVGVSRFSQAMSLKLAKKRNDGKGGWNRPAQAYHTGCSPEHLRRLLATHIKKGDLVDIANFCMMIWNRENPKGDKHGI